MRTWCTVGDWTAVSWFWFRTSWPAQRLGPTSRVPSQESSPRKPQLAMQELPGTITQRRGRIA
jgi:hypothetical protein